jgi:CHAT domain-containing protein
MDLARTLSALGEVARQQRQFADASRSHEEALAIRRRLAPGSATEAESLYALGQVARAQGRATAARERWTQAVRALESQRGHLALSEQGKTAFGARYSAIFRDLIELMVDLGQSKDAFHLLERSRARSFLTMLAERDLVFSADDVPAPLLRAQRRVDAEYDQVQRRLAAADSVRDGEEIDTLQAQLEELRSRRDRTAAKLREASPRLGSLQHPEPLDLDGARRTLDPGTLLLSYSVGRTRTLLFALAATAEGAAGSLRVFAIPVGEEALRRRVETFRSFIARGRGTSEIEPALVEQGRQLFEDLLGPARPAILTTRRLLIIADGPLHALPFAALAVDASRTPRYLGELEPLHVAASMTVYAELKKARARMSPRQGPILVAFGDPQRLPPSGEDERTADAAASNSSVPARALRLGPLPASRAEVEAVSALFPGSTRAYLGSRATEDQAKALRPGPRFIHFACHGLLDERFPLDSALVLARAPNDATGNGLLQAWEILESIRIDAELVTLSACESGRGREMGGEGLVGLSRAFQHAGASSVLASLWAVSDRSTAEWMGHFYAALERGLPKDEAVQAAQGEMRRREPYSHPFHWAAFQLSGLGN